MQVSVLGRPWKPSESILNHVVGKPWKPSRPLILFNPSCLIGRGGTQRPLCLFQIWIRRGQLNFWCMGSQENYLRLVGRQNNNAKFQRSNYISLLCDSMLSNVLIFRFYPFYCNRKEKNHIRRKINSNKKNIYLWNQYYYFDLPKIRVRQACMTKNWVALVAF